VGDYIVLKSENGYSSCKGIGNIMRKSSIMSHSWGILIGDTSIFTIDHNQYMNNFYRTRIKNYDDVYEPYSYVGWGNRYLKENPEIIKEFFREVVYK
jgi:hypothetical protein